MQTPQAKWFAAFFRSLMGDFLKVAHLRVFGVALWRLMVKAGVDGG
jgi:hypothetical protein